MRANLLTRLVRFLTLHRRLVATLAAMLSVTALAVVLTGRDQVLVEVVTVVQRVEAGQTVTADAVRLTGVPQELLPQGALTQAETAVGRLAAAGLPVGAIVTTDALVTSAGRSSAAGRLVMPLTLTQPELVDLLRPGDAVALIVSDPYGETTVIDDVVIVGLPQSDSGGLLASSTTSSILIDVSDAVAAQLTAARAASTITIALR
ncbi:MAG: SAF domain-containing protein [Propionibacteriaceae bacterium]|jgi:Flp pilus assembly protein CpaB|nr:SAF domain-containing protein [Propionibacteriaceae bacterium]